VEKLFQPGWINSVLEQLNNKLLQIRLGGSQPIKPII